MVSYPLRVGDIASRVMCGQLFSKGWGYCVTGDVWSVIQ